MPSAGPVTEVRFPALASSAVRVRRLLPWLALTAAAAALQAHRHEDYDVVPTVMVTGIGALILYVVLYATDKRRMIAGAAAGLAGLAVWYLRLAFSGFAIGVDDALGATGAGIFAFEVWRWRRASGEEAGEARDFASLAIVYPLLTITALGIVSETARVLPSAWDARAYALDASLPIHSFHVGQLLVRSPLLKTVAELVYDGIFFLLPVLCALRLRLRPEHPVDLLVLCVFASLAAQLGYFVTPVVGPAYAFQSGFPDHLPSLAMLPKADVLMPPWPRNCMPSVHTVWGLVFFWNTKPFGRAARAFGVFVLAFTVIATLGLGYHYVVDLVAAVPFAVVAQAIATRVEANRTKKRRIVVAGEAALALAWILAPRTWPESLVLIPGVVAGLAVVTVGVSVWALRAIDRCAVTQPANAGAPAVTRGASE